MLPSILSVELARWQFAIAACVHFLFVPLTLGLTWILCVMELLYVMTKKDVYKQMTQFWGKLLGINFALGVLTGLVMAFSFGTNWAYYSQYVGDIFGTPLAIEGLLAFMLESTFFGIFFFGWDKVTPKQHLCSTFCLAIGSTLSALLILVANGFMQHPMGAVLNSATMRMETTSLLDLFLNPMAQVGFLHTIFAGYLTSAVFVLGISAFYLLRHRHVDFAKRSFAVAAGFGLVVSMMVVFAGDQSGMVVGKEQPAKLAAIEAHFVTARKAPFNIFAFPDQDQGRNRWALQIPDVLGLIVAHDYSAQIPGANNIIEKNNQRIHSGILAYKALEKIRTGDSSLTVLNEFKQHKNDLGYGLLLSDYTHNIVDATPLQIDQAARSTIPDIWSIFYTFRVMVGLGFLMVLLFIVAFIKVLRKSAWQCKPLLYASFFSIPLPWLCVLCGWYVTEHGRQPWTVYGILPTSISASFLNAADLWLSFTTFILLFAALIGVEMFLMIKFARLGPEGE